MLFSLITLWTVTILLALCVLALGRAHFKAQSALHDLKAEFRGRFDKVIGNPVPSFEATTIDGKQHFTDRDLHNHSALLVFLSPTCHHCYQVIEQLIEEAPHWRAVGGIVVGVSNGDSLQMMKLATRAGVNFPILAQDQWELAQLFQVNSTPWGFAIASSGVVTTSGVLGTPEQLHALMDAAKVPEPIY